MDAGDLLQSFLSSWYCYVPTIVVFYLMEKYTRGGFGKQDPEDEDDRRYRKKHQRLYAKLAMMLICTTAIDRVASHHVEVLDLLVLAIWWGWTLWTFIQE